MKWISVKKELPNDDETVLGANETLRQYLPVFCYYEEETEYFYSISDGHALPLIITHWMKIPLLKAKK